MIPSQNVPNAAIQGLLRKRSIGKELSTTTTADPFMTKYLFPGGNMPSIAQIGAAVEKSFVMEDWHLIGPDYDKTLMAWTVGNALNV